MPRNDTTAARILAAHARNSADATAACDAARAAGLSEAEIALLDAQADAARRMYQQLVADMPTKPSRRWWPF